MRSSQGGGPIPLRIDGKVLPEKAAEREPTALARPACMSGRGVKQEGPRRGGGAGPAPHPAGLLEDVVCTDRRMPLIDGSLIMEVCGFLLRKVGVDCRIRWYEL
jgi:hypothetical protein